MKGNEITMPTLATYTVAGMTCGHCVAAVTDEVTALPGVTAVHVDLAAAAGAASTVTVSSDAPLTDEQVRAAVEEAGYELVGAAS
jgi:copper chaperone CopZ